MMDTEGPHLQPNVQYNTDNVGISGEDCWSKLQKQPLHNFFVQLNRRSSNKSVVVVIIIRTKPSTGKPRYSVATERVLIDVNFSSSGDLFF